MYSRLGIQHIFLDRHLSKESGFPVKSQHQQARAKPNHKIAPDTPQYHDPETHLEQVLYRPDSDSNASKRSPNVSPVSKASLIMHAENIKKQGWV